MIIVQLLGGLGNQMFQYALGKHLATLNNCELKLDLEEFTQDPLRNYHLNFFCLPQTFAKPSEINHLKFGHNIKPIAKIETFFNRVCRRLTGKKPIKKISYVIEKEMFKFNTKILGLRGHKYLEGYWQSEKYFSDIRKILLDNFTLKNEASTQNSSFLKQIRACNSVSLHVRRGDYITNPGTKKLYACCNSGYYQSAIEAINSRIATPRFFVFSDDPDWAESNLVIENKVIIKGNNAENAHEDLRLMQNCRHHIIANSSFSWWGAWLNQNSDKIVIAPKTWINLPKVDTRDLIPDGWLRI